MSPMLCNQMKNVFSGGRLPRWFGEVHCVGARHSHHNHPIHLLVHKATDILVRHPAIPFVGSELILGTVSTSPGSDLRAPNATAVGWFKSRSSQCFSDRMGCSAMLPSLCLVGPFMLPQPSTKLGKLAQCCVLFEHYVRIPLKCAAHVDSFSPLTSSACLPLQRSVPETMGQTPCVCTTNTTVLALVVKCSFQWELHSYYRLTPSSIRVAWTPLAQFGTCGLV